MEAEFNQRVSGPGFGRAPGWDDRERVAAELAEVSEVLDPVLASLGFAAGQPGAHVDAGQVVSCRGMIGSSDDGCVDVVVELEKGVGASGRWVVAGARYDGLPSPINRLDVLTEAPLAVQLADLAERLPAIISKADAV